MHLPSIRAEARRRVAAGESTVAVALRLGVSQSAVWRWANRTFTSDTTEVAPCWICHRAPVPHEHRATYAYLLGQYLGDGHLVTSARVPVLRVYACTDYPAIVQETETAVSAVRGVPPGRVQPAKTQRMVVLQSYWNHWPCLLPQHGPGRKHERPIALTGWQQAIVDEHPWPLVRGLIHSDGCRAINRIVTRARTYEYPRYFFANESRDILSIMGSALDSVGVRWRYNRPNSISIARRDAVAAMEAHVGPKA